MIRLSNGLGPQGAGWLCSPKTEAGEGMRGGLALALVALPEALEQAIPPTPGLSLHTRLQHSLTFTLCCCRYCPDEANIAGNESIDNALERCSNERPVSKNTDTLRHRQSHIAASSYSMGLSQGNQ